MVWEDENQTFHAELGDNMNHRYEVMEYTGLRDINDKEIYEEDIVKLYTPGSRATIIIGKVVYGLCMYEIHGINEYRGISKGLNPLCEVIGNPYEHPHLIKCPNLNILK